MTSPNSDSASVKKVAYLPKGIHVPHRILYAMVPVGEVSMQIWLDCISERVQKMLERKRWFRRRYANKICKKLSIPPCSDLENFGKYIINYQSEFERWVIAFIGQGQIPFPAIVLEQDDDVFEDIQVVNLGIWAGLVSLMTSGILLNDTLRFADYAINKQFFESEDREKFASKLAE